MLYRNNQFLCGDYVRLSREDGDKLVSNSIHNQKELISDYHKRHPELIYVKTYVDDGYSGTNFDRPGFQQMMKDAQNGFINCIIVKDLSRLGRDYIEMGRYTERIFPLMGIRFIAINDGYDSAKDANDSQSIVVPFKNLINDAYCRDLSMKIRSQLDVKRKNGEFIGSFAAYGYMKDPEDKNHLIVDEHAADVIRNIFDWKLSGMSSRRIAKRLDDEGELPPREYKLSRGLNCTQGFQPGENPKWQVKSVNRILQDELYTGALIQKKRKKINYRVKQMVAVDDKDRIKVENAHEPIISKETFIQAQNILELTMKPASGKDTCYMFSGFVRCGDCGQNMVRRNATQGGKEYIYYHCSTYKNGKGCTSHLVSEKKLEETVLQAIRKQAALFSETEKAETAVTKEKRQERSVKTLDDQISRLESEVERYRNLKNHLYDDMRDGIIDREEYKELGSRFIRQMKKAQDSIQGLEDKKKTLLGREDKVQSWVEEFCKYGNIIHLDRKVLAATVDHITVYSKDRIEVHFLYEDEMNELLGQTKACKDEASANRGK